MSRPPPPRAKRTLARQPPPPGIYASSYEPELAAAICRRLAAGESLRSICRADPAMPTEKTVWNWARAHPEFRLMKAHAVTAARAARLAAHQARAQAKAARASRTGRQAWNKGLIGYPRETVLAVFDALTLGAPLGGACRQAGVRSVATFYNWVRARPELLELYRRSRETAFEYIADMTADAALSISPDEPLRALNRLERRAHARCGKIAPRTYARPLTTSAVVVVAQREDAGGGVVSERRLYPDPSDGPD